ncbi:response regulator [Pedobacter fastidiosus]|uniref:Response regulator transcription factor n=1 Tax=Pedobacter fastidiosus TaxID=2765361 RepID=A0ABR7KX83_9SPHI|nr:response regulator transcription factor [Pedobacter fastidiosus]MBC6112313.1 response regulator transcription factor [Pedobacter fastidiosus]
MIKILIADDHNMLINGLKLILAVRKDFNVIASANNGIEVIELVKKEKPDLILLDINMPMLNGYQTIRLLKSDFPEINVIVLSMLNDKRSVWNMLEAGAKGYLFKNTDDKNLFKAIDEVSNGRYYVTEDIESILEEFLQNNKNPDKGNKPQLLSSREIEIVRLIVDGNTNAQIADMLYLSIRTVDTHRKNIFHKLNLNNAASLVKYALENKIFLGLD